VNIIDFDKHRAPADAIKQLEKQFNEILASLDQHTPITREELSKIKADAETRYLRKHRIAFGFGGIGAAILLASIVFAGYLDFIHASGLPVILPFAIGLGFVFLAWLIDHRAAERRDDIVGRFEPADPRDVERIAKLAKKSADVRRSVARWVSINPVLTRREANAVHRCLERIRQLEPTLQLNRALLGEKSK
jgi:hypothetical protein